MAKDDDTGASFSWMGAERRTGDRRAAPKSNKKPANSKVKDERRIHPDRRKPAKQP